MLKDSILFTRRTDSVRSPAIAAQLEWQDKQLRHADISVTIGLDTVNRLLNDVSSAYLQMADLQSNVNDRLKAAPGGKLNKETAYIWSAPREESQTNIATNLGNTYQGQDEVFVHFVSGSWGDRLLVLLLVGFTLFGSFLTTGRRSCQNSKKILDP